MLPLQINRDGKPDLMILERTSVGNLTLKFLRNTGTNYSDTNAPNSINIEYDDNQKVENQHPKVQPIDLDGDGDSELIVGPIKKDNQVYWRHYSKNNDGQYTFQQLSDLNHVYDASFVDINGDGLADILYRKSNSNNVWGNKAKLNQNGGYTAPIVLPNPNIPEQIEGDLHHVKLVKKLADFNGGGQADILFEIQQ